MTLRILLLEDHSRDAEIALEHLVSTGLDVTAHRVLSSADFAQGIVHFRPAVILFDDGAPQFTALAALELLEGEGLATPFIVLTNGLDEGGAVAVMRAGADDIVPKAQLDRLRPALDRALQVRAGLRKLSPRQVEVLRLVAEGLTTPAIADVLGISVKTAETHRTEMMKRLDIHDVASLVRYAVKVRLVPRPV